MTAPEVFSRAGIEELFAAAMWSEAEETVRARLAAVDRDSDVPASVVRCWWSFLTDGVHRSPDAQAAGMALPGERHRVAGAASLTPARADAGRAR